VHFYFWNITLVYQVVNNLAIRVNLHHKNNRRTTSIRHLTGYIRPLTGTLVPVPSSITPSAQQCVSVSLRRLYFLLERRRRVAPKPCVNPLLMHLQRAWNCWHTSKQAIPCRAPPRKLCSFFCSSLLPLPWTLGFLWHIPRRRIFLLPIIQNRSLPHALEKQGQTAMSQFKTKTRFRPAY